MSRVSHEKARPSAPKSAFMILGVVLFLLYLPIIVMMLNSFIIRVGDSLALTLEWYIAIFNDADLISALKRSLYVGISASTVATLLGGMAAIALARTRFRFSKPLQGMSFMSLIIPELVFALALLSWFFILKIPLSLMTVIFAHITFSLSFVLMTVSGRFQALDPSVEDAARDLGASEFLILRRIIIPLLIPALSSGFLLAFLLSFDDFLITFYTNGVGSDTLPIRLYVAMKMGLSPKLSALATLMFLFSLALITLLMKIRGGKALDI